MRRNQFFSHVSNQKQGLLNRAQELSEFIVSAAVAWLKAVMGAYWEPNVLIFALKSFVRMHSSFKWHGGEGKKKSRRQWMLSADYRHNAVFIFNSYLSLKELMRVHILSECLCFQELEAALVNGKKKSVN